MSSCETISEVVDARYKEVLAQGCDFSAIAVYTEAGNGQAYCRHKSVSPETAQPDDGETRFSRLGALFSGNGSIQDLEGEVESEFRAYRLRSQSTLSG